MAFVWYLHKDAQALQLHVLQSKQLGSSNEGLTQELALTDAELSELQQQLSATRAQTFNMRCRGDQLSQEVSMLLRVSLAPRLSICQVEEVKRERGRCFHALAEPSCGMLRRIM